MGANARTGMEKIIRKTESLPALLERASYRWYDENSMKKKQRLPQGTGERP